MVVCGVAECCEGINSFLHGNHVLRSSFTFLQLSVLFIIYFIFLFNFLGIQAWNFENNTEFSLNAPCGLVCKMVVDDDKLFAGMEVTFIARWYPGIHSLEAFGFMISCNS